MELGERPSDRREIILKEKTFNTFFMWFEVIQFLERIKVCLSKEYRYGMFSKEIEIRIVPYESIPYGTVRHELTAPANKVRYGTVPVPYRMVRYDT